MHSGARLRYEFAVRIIIIFVKYGSSRKQQFAYSERHCCILAVLVKKKLLFEQFPVDCQDTFYLFSLFTVKDGVE